MDDTPPQTPAKPDAPGIFDRLPIYLLLPTSVLFFWGDRLLFDASRGDESIYVDASVRAGMGMDVFVLALQIGSILLIVAAVRTIRRSVARRSPDWPRLALVLLGILSHPFVSQRALDWLFPPG